MTTVHRRTLQDGTMCEISDGESLVVPRTDLLLQIIFKGKDPYDPASWSNAVHFNFTGYDPEPFWDVDGKTYINGAHAWQVG